MTHSGPAGSPEGDGAFPTRRELRNRRESAATTAGSELTATPALSTTALSSTVSTTPAVGVTATGVPAVPVPLVPVPSLTVPPAPKRSASAAAGPAGSRPPRSARTAKRRNPLAKIVTLVAIPAIFLTAALPAYAFAPQGGSVAASAKTPVAAQAVTVGAAAAAVTIAADGFTATSQAELDEIEAAIQADLAQQQAADAARSAAADFAVYGIRAEGDDYPWMSASTESQGGGLSPLGYYYRECVDFVAWRLNRDAGATNSPWKWTWGKLTPGGGNASAWANGWAAKGWPTGKEPVVGAVAWFTYNHVAYVQSVPGDGTVVLEEYNWMGSHAYHTRTVPISEVPLYLYPPA